ncbi:hypothetical protein MLD38_017673 [Melastoma candidum]|uniref:Uncharacterized protein n=1 Tax=Melastoma candidum TaxID=119954 RepID=A0ACB9QUW9_9MYRT|nr:hypothetical protein MLD38_017673 [Melastoma candidum]
MGVEGGDGVGATAHVLVLPYPVQGHINPMLQFSKRLESKGTRITFLIPTSKSRPIQVYSSGSIRIVPIPDGNEGLVAGKDIDVKAYLQRFRDSVMSSLADFLDSQGYSEMPAQAVVYDAFMPWVLDVAEPRGLSGAPFFTQSCVVCGVYYHVHEGVIRIPLEQGESTVVVEPPAMSILGPGDLPSFVSDIEMYPDITRLVVEQFSNLKRARWALFNTFVELEEEVAKWMSRDMPLLTIGPTIPSMYLDKRLKDDTDYGLSLFKPELEASTEWLDSNEEGSVVYISFGSLAALGEEQMEEIANGLKRIKSNFLSDRNISKFISELTTEARSG